MVTKRLLIDCDPGHDDALAILVAAGSAEAEFVGITTVAGNQTLGKTTRNALTVAPSVASFPSRSSPVTTDRSSARCARHRSTTGERARRTASP